MSNIKELVEKSNYYKAGLLNKASLLLSSILGEFLIEDPSLIDNKIKELKSLDFGLGEDFSEAVVWVLWDDYAKKSPLSGFEGYFSYGIQIDIELSRKFENILEELEDEDIVDRVNDILKNLSEELIRKTRELIDSLGISEDDLDCLKNLS